MASRARVGSDAWRRFEERRDAVLPVSQALASAASADASAGTKAARARQATERFTGRGDRRRDDARWAEQLAAYSEVWQRDGRAPSPTSADPDVRHLGQWMAHQWTDLYAGRLPAERVDALKAAGIPTDRDKARGRKWRSRPPSAPGAG